MSGSGRTIPIGAAELRAIRERESVLEQTLARLTGVDTATVERIENGETPLSTLEPDQIRQWAKTLGVNPARLTGETPQEGEGATTVIRRMRTERGWSCPQLAAHANVPYRSLRQYDSGERDTANMAAGILARVAIALDTSMEKLMPPLVATLRRKVKEFRDSGYVGASDTSTRWSSRSFPPLSSVTSAAPPVSVSTREASSLKVSTSA